MRRVLFTTISALALTATGALAADIPRPAPSYKAPIVAAPPIFTWTGFYLGINGGYGFGKSDWDGLAGNADPKGGLVGGTIGYNWQTGPWVWGLEGDIDWSNIRGSFANGVCPLGCETRNSWLATARGRLGYAFGRIMPYVTGGLAVGDVRHSFGPLVGDRETRAGFAAGAGLEGAVTNNVTAKIEYLYADLGDTDCGVLVCGLPTKVDFHAHIVRGGVNFKF